MRGDQVQRIARAICLRQSPPRRRRAVDELLAERVEERAKLRLGQAIGPDIDLPVEANAIAHAAVIAAQRLGLATIAVVTGSGGAARLMSEYRPKARIIALTSNEQTYRRLAPYWGVTPMHFPLAATTDELLTTVERVLREHDLAQAGDKVVVTAGLPVGSGVSTNTLQIHNMP